MGTSGITSRSLNLKHISESSSPLENKLSYKDWKESRPESTGVNEDPVYNSRKAYRKDKAYDESNPYTSGRKLGNVLRDVLGSRVKDNKVASASFAEGDKMEGSVLKPQKTTTGKIIQDVRNIGKNVGKKIGDTAKQVFPDKDTRHGKLTGEVYGKDSEFAGAGIREGGTIQERQKKFTQKRADRINSRIRSDNPDGGSFFGNKLRQIKSRLAADPSKSVQSKDKTVKNQDPNINSGVEGTSLTKIPGIQTLRGNYNSVENLANRIFKKDPIIETKFPETKSSNDFLNKYRQKK